MAKKGKSDGVIRLDTYNKWFNWCLIAICFLVLLAVRLQVNQGTTGDEPYYLLMDYSLVHDHDLNLNNNFQHKDYLSFYDGPLQPQGTDGLNSAHAHDGYSTHGTGLPLLLSPGFLIAAKTGAVFEMVLLATLVVYLTWVWTKQITHNRMTAYIAATFLTISYFFNGLVGAIYPDMLIAALILISLILIERYYKQPKYQILIGLVLGFSILVHFKTLDFVLPALAVLSYKLWTTERKLPWRAVLIVAAFLAYYELSLYHWFGVWNLSTVEGGQSFGANPFHNVSAMLFDSNRGLLIYNPILLLIFVGLPLWFKNHRGSLLTTLVILLPPIVVLSLIPNWDGSAAPTGRYIIEFLPAFIPAIAFSLERLYRAWQKVVIGLLAIITFLISLDATMLKFPIINGNILAARAPLFLQIQGHTGLSLDRFIPTYSIQSKITILASKHAHIILAVDYLIVLSLLIYGYYLSRSLPKARSLR